MAKAPVWDAPVLLALLSSFFGTLAMWWLYFGTASKDAIATITHSDDPGRIGAYFHYVHAILVAGIIATAVGNDLVLAHPHAAPIGALYASSCPAGPAIYLLGSAIYKKVGVWRCSDCRISPASWRSRNDASGFQRWTCCRSGLADHGRDAGGLPSGKTHRPPPPAGNRAA